MSRRREFIQAGAVGLGVMSLPGPVRAQERRVRDPYMGALVTAPLEGRVLFEERAEVPARPASLTKLMTLYAVLEEVRAGRLRLQDPIPVTAEAARVGGSQVYLKEGEVFPLDEMLYALMIKSANDVARALALKVAGSREAFVARMNEYAARLGMTATEFHTEHGLPPAAGQRPDISTARDMARLSTELLQHHNLLRYTSTKVRGFRNNTFELRSHNRLLLEYPGCDGLKTGYYYLAGWSIAATAVREGRRVLAVVLGSPERPVRDQAAARLLDRGFNAL